MSSRIKIAVIGDVHGNWDLEQDSRALQYLQAHACINELLLLADLVLFTGDYGKENVELVKSISNLKFPKATILGNHDCKYTVLSLDTRKNPVDLQLECLGEAHVGYRRLDFSELKLSVLGGRPFSRGGQKLNKSQLLSSRYQVRSMEESAEKICEAANGTPQDHSIIILAHNGPTGLGSDVSDICGIDWDSAGGDYGDPDLARAISELQANVNIRIPLVVFGHMHKTLKCSESVRKMIVVSAGNLIYLNCAIVPRVEHLRGTYPGSTSESHNKHLTSGTSRAFTMVEMQNGQVEEITETWVRVVGSEIEIDKNISLFQKH